MKIKALAITSLFVAAGALQGQAQEAFSANAVGYVKKSFGPGFSLFSNPLIAENNTVASLLADAPAGTIVYKFNPETGFAANSNIAGLGWLDTAMTLEPGEGAFISVPDGAQVDAIFVGEVAQGELTTDFPAGFSLASSQVPQEAPITQLGLDANSVSAVYKFDNASNGYTAFPAIAGVGFLPEPTIGIGEAVFLEAAAPGSWTRTFSVSE